MIAWWIAATWNASLRGGAALLLAWLVSSVPRVPAAVRCWAWRAAFGVVLASFLWTQPIDLPLLRPSVSASPQAVGPSSNLASGMVAPPVDNGREGSIAASRGGIPSVDALHPARMRNAGPAFSWVSLAFALWLGFLAAYAVRLSVGWSRARRLATGRALHVPELAALCDRMGIRRPPVVRVHSACRGPLLVGSWRPTIVLPEIAVGSRHLPLILAHEMAHQKRGDLLWNWLTVLATAALPIHPLVWVGKRGWKLATEAACDAEALAATSAEPAEYGRVLVDAGAAFPSAPGVMAVAVAAESRWLLKRRLLAMQHISLWGRSRLTTAGLILSIGAFAAAVPWRVVARAADKPSDAQTAGHMPAGRTSAPAAQLPDNHFNTPPQLIGFISVPQAHIRSLSSGTIQHVSCEEGQQVKRGDLLAQLDGTDRQKSVDLAERILKTSQERFQFVRQQQQAGLATPPDLANAQLEADKANDVLQQRQAALAETRIVAPIDGIVEDLKATVGSTVLPGDPIATVFNVSKATIDFTVSSDLARQLKKNDPVAILSQQEERIGSGRIVAFGPSDAANAVTNVRIKILTSKLPVINPLPVEVKFHIEDSQSPEPKAK